MQSALYQRAFISTGFPWRGVTPIADFRVHPGQLCSKFAGGEETVRWVHTDRIHRSSLMPHDDLFRGWVEYIAQEFFAPTAC